MSSSPHQHKRPASENGDDVQRVSKQKTEESPTEEKADDVARDDAIAATVSNDNDPSDERFPRLDKKHMDQDYSYFQPSIDMDYQGTIAVVAGRPTVRKTNLSVFSNAANANWELTQLIPLRGVNKPESISVSGNLIVLGVTNENNKRAIHLYKYDMKKQKWKKVNELSGPEGFANFASNVKLDGNVLLVNPKRLEWNERRGKKKQCPIYVYRIDGKNNLSQETCKSRYQDWGYTIAGVKGNFFATYDHSSIYIYESDTSKKERVWRCIERFQPVTDYIDNEDEETHSHQTRFAKNIEKAVICQDGSLLVGFSVALPGVSWGYNFKYGALHYYTRSSSGNYVLKQRVKLYDKYIWVAKVVDIAVDGNKMVVSVDNRTVASMQDPNYHNFCSSYKYTLVDGDWKEQQSLPFYSRDLHLSGNKLIIAGSNNALYYTLEKVPEEGMII